MKRLVVCCDGTWNTQDQTDGGVPSPTNVTRLFNAVLEAASAGSETEQQKYYHPGVGTDPGLVSRALGGGIGIGLDRNIKSAYRNLCDQYKSGDAIYLFGFSRGAYTVRSLAGFIGRVGLLDTAGLDDKTAWERIDTAFDAGYRKRRNRSAWRGDDWSFHRTEAGDEAISIRFLGVWDTVGALGIPDDLAFLNLIDSLNDYTFHDTDLGDSVETARHAVALDEMRGSFQPTLWTGIAPGRDVQQIWFPGVHSDVGGGYAETGLSDGALRWMVDEATAAGLAFSQNMIGQIRPDHRAPLHDSLTGVFKVLPTQPRSAPALDRSDGLHGSARHREQDPPLTQSPYWPTRRLAVGEAMTREVYAKDPWNNTRLFLEEGACYDLSAAGEWLDKNIPCGPAGADDGKFHAGELAHLFGSLLGEFEELFKRIGGNQNANFLMTKRYETMPWFSLVGTIANGSRRAERPQQPHQTFLIGDGIAGLEPERAGYLYAFANDAWRFYGNNGGRVLLTVRRVS